VPAGEWAVIISPMSVDDTDAVTFGLRLTGPELKITYTALRALRDDLGRHEADVSQIVQAVLDKLPDEHTIRAISISAAPK
jgi:hypothetical protein